MGLADKVLKGDEKSAARLISLIEEGEEEGYEALRCLFPHTGRAHVIGITGPAGSGKSTVTGHVAVQFAAQGFRVGVIAIDPTSMRGKGALLGDRVRMKEAEKTGGIFIRSMAHRGYPGGVARAATGAAYVLEGLGKNLIIIESVGAGQSDKALFLLADTVITLLTPDYGDEIQLLKAGLLEIGDIIVVNKKDKPGAEDAWRELLHRCGRLTEQGWLTPVLLTRADRNEGIDALLQAVQSHWRFLKESTTWKQQKQEKITSFTSSLLKEELWKRFLEQQATTAQFERVMQDVQAGRKDPYTAADELLGSTAPVVERKGRKEQTKGRGRGKKGLTN